ncbi:MAG TPA: FAD-dependent oxidoreductase [Roseiflexaceae bacterium]|nr:FAD-dependent oxidoreductase [Roseiflexaceae bacterium]
MHLVILGGGYAGLMAAARAARTPAIRVTLVDAAPHFTQRIRLHEALAGSDPRTLAYAPLLARRGVGFLQGRADEIDPQRQRLAGRAADGTPFALDYDLLILALGSAGSADAPGVADHALRLDNQETVRRASTRVRELAAAHGRALVVGGGLTGIEAAAELAERHPGLRVTLATRGALGEDYAPEGRAHLHEQLARLGVELAENTPVTELEPGRALLSGGGALPFDLCIWSGGMRAAQLGRAAGLETDSLGRVLVGPTLQTPAFPSILAAGDAAAPQIGFDIRMSCASAMPMGAQAGENARRLLAGTEPLPLDFGFSGRCVSLGRTDGLLQFTEPDDSARPQVWTGRRAAITKELVCRMTTLVISQELRTGWSLYRWPASPARGARGLRLEA